MPREKAHRIGPRVEEGARRARGDGTGKTTEGRGDARAGAAVRRREKLGLLTGRAGWQARSAKAAGRGRAGSVNVQ